MINIKYFLVVHLLFSFCSCEISKGQKEKLLNGFLQYYNGLPNQVYHGQEGSLLNTQQVDETTYQIVANVRVGEINNAEATKWLKCTASIQDSDNVITVSNNNCEDAVEEKQSPIENPETTLEAQVEVSEPPVERKPVQLDNEVQADTAITSGEQFIAIPRDQPSAPCMGCATHVNPQAAGVSELADLGVRHLDLHEPAVKHSLESVIDVERQVQVVNGVRYILTVSIHSNNCTQVDSENCASSKICKITILVKPWVKLSNGGHYRAILTNNCTEEWLFGENGEVLPEPSTGDNPVQGNTSVDPGDDDIQIKYNTNVQSQPNQEKTLTDDDLKKIQEQIITYAQFQEVTESAQQSFTTAPDTSDVSKQHVFKIESEKHTENSIPVTESEKTEHQAFNINLDKKKAIDEMLDFFDFSGFKPKTEAEEVVPRVRRSYDYDLQVLSLAEDFHGIKNSIENARFMYTMAQAMVDYLNEMDMEVKNRAVKNVIRAEEETENLRRFVYIQARVTIPCDKVECESKEVDTQICNGVLDCSNENSPQILTTFCYNDNKESDYREDIREIDLDDPVLRKMAEKAVKQIESESKSQYALKMNKIASAITQVTSGTLTKFSVIVENIKCNKSVPLPLRINCTVLEQLGTKICDVIVHERHWLKEKKMSYTCTDRPADMRISKGKKVNKNVTTDDPEIIEMLQEAIQYLESQSDKANKQKIVSIKSISSQIIAGFLTKIEFFVGYTDCTDENYSRDQINKCELLNGEGMRSCKAQIWDRSWIMDGRQIEVSCDDATKNNEIVNTRKKRSIDSTSDQKQRSLRSDLDYKQLANESLYKFMQSSSSHQHYEVIKVDKAVVQDVSRKLIKIDFSISPTDCMIQNDGTLSSSECEIVNPKNIIHCRSKILENNWIDKKQYFVKCKIKYQPQKNDNELRERNPSDSKYFQLAEESLAKYLQDTGNPNHVIVRVEKVTTQLVSGLLTRIDFIISPKSQSVTDSKTVRCHSEILEKHWLGTKAFNVSCQMKKNINKIDDTDEINVDDPKYMQIAVESLQKYIKNKPESNLVRVAFVDKIVRKEETLIISFIASHAEEGDGDTLCFAEVSETIESKSELNVKCHFIGTIFREAEIIEDDPNYYKYVKLADECLHNYLQKTNSSLYTLVSIESVTVEWDEGIKTLINFNISPDSENSEITQSKHCIAEILEKPWLLKDKIIQDVKCELDKDLYRIKRRVSNVRIRRQLGGIRKSQLVGGQQNQDQTDPRYRALAEESLRKYVVDAGITQPLAVARVEKVTTQVVSGSLTRLDFLVSGSLDSPIIKCHSEVWEQVWLNKKEITVTCQNDGSRSKRGIRGGRQDQDTTDPKYQALAEESLRKYVVDFGITQPLAVARIEKVTTQVVSGSLTRLDFLVSGSSDSPTIKCHSKVWEQVWLNKKEINVTCQNDGSRSKRVIPGGEQDQDTTDPKYQALAEESLRKYVVDSGIAQPLAVARIEKVTTQVVSGSLTRLDFLVSGSTDSPTIKCHSEVWERKWLNKNEITVTCQNDGHRSKRGIPGGEQDQDTTDPKYQALAEECLRKYVVDSGIAQPLAVARIEKVTTQVVSGSLTRLDFLVSGSSDSPTIKCHSKVWEQVWLNKKEINVTCQNDGSRSKRGIPGGEQDQDTTDPMYQALAEESLRKYVVDSGIAQPLAVARIEKVTTQVVSGSLTRLDFLVSGSTDSPTIKCHSEVWERKWLNKKEITVTCQNDGHRSKRGIPGGEQDQDTTDPKYQALAEESLRKYVVDSGIAQPLAVARIEKVTTQVVSGSLTRLDFLVSGSSDSPTIKCHSKVWEQVWLNKKEINVTCQNDGSRSKRGIPGGEQDQDTTDPMYQALAEESLRKYVVDSGIAQPLAVARIEKVTTQVVSGSLTRLDFLVSGSTDSPTIKCHSEVWERKWLNKKEITVTCQNDGHRSKRGIPGGEQDQDSTDPKYQALAEESLRKYVVDSGIAQSLAVARIEKVTTQVVSGSLTRLDFLVSGSTDSPTIKCHSEVWERKWLNKKEITVTCQNDGHKSKRGIPGGEQDQDTTDPKYQALAEESLRKYVVDSGIAQPLAVARIEKVTTQVVSGSLTRLDFLVSGSSDSPTIKCHSKVWEQVWLNKKEINVTCQNDGSRSKRGIPGGEQDQDTTDPKYQALAEESLRKYVVDSGIAQPLAVARIEKVTTQVVSGSLTRLDFLVSGSTDSPTIKCHSEVWERKWLNKKEITVTCQNDGHRSKRGIPGGEQDQDTTDPKYQALAEESLRKYVVDSGIAQPLAVARIEKVTTQVVSGSLTRLDFLVSVSTDSPTIKCHSEVWERKWLNKKEITVTCQNDGHKSKRGIPGGEQDQDTTDPKYQALAEESLRKYVVDSGIAQPLAVARIEKVTTQVVSGSLTRLDFLVSGSSDSPTIKCHSKVWEQVWLNKKEINVTCQNDGSRSKRGIPGGEQDQDTTDPKYQALAEESLRKYVVDSGIAQPLAVARIEKVTTQVVSGSLTRLDFVVSGSSDSPAIKCHSEVWERKWLNKKEITVTCQNDGHRSKRGIPGGEQDQDTTDPKYQALAEESLRKYVVDSGIAQPLAVARIEKVTTQVVSGSLTRLDFLVSGSTDSPTIKCHSEVWERKWLNKKEITVTCQNDGHRSKRGIPGGEQDQDTTDPKYQALAEESLRKYVVDSGIAQPLAVARIEKVTTQVVSGSLTRLDFLVSVSTDSPTIKCHSEVWERKWLNKKEITVTCQNDGHKSKRGIRGGEQDQDTTDPKYQALAEESLRKYVVDSGIAQPLAVARIEKVTTQVVSGSLTRLDFLVSGSSDSPTIKCHSKVWEQVWLNKKEINVTCQNDGSRSKRGIPGGEQDQDTTDPKYQALAEESLRKYVVDSGIAQPLAVARIEKVTTQVVSGSLTRLDFVVSGSSDSPAIKCHSEVWERKWLNKKEITVTCQNDGHRSKRGIPGGEQDQDTTDPKYQALAEESLRKYVVDSGIAQPLAVARIEKVTTQVVSGSLTRLDFLVSGSTDSPTIKCHSEVWERKWLNKKEITVTCQNDGHRSKRGIPGGEQDQDTTDPKYQALAEESLRKYVVDSGIAQPLAVARIEKVTTQVVSGSLTRLDFLVSVSTDSPTIKCHSEVWERKWLNKKEITVTCQNDGHKSKRGIPGGEQDQDTTDPKYQALAEESLRKYVVDSGIAQPLAVARIEKVTTQVVSGSLTRLDFLVSGSSDSPTIKCHSKVWEQVWLNKKEINVTCQNDGSRSKRGIPGGEQDQDTTDPKYQALAEESLRKYVVDSGIAQPLAVARIEKVTTQVVSGSLTRLDFVVSGSSDSPAIKCHSEVWERKWLNKKEITVTCQNDGHRSKRGIPGGEQDQDTTDPKYQALAEESLRKYVVDSGITQPLAVARIEKVTTQVVSGSMTRLDFLVSGSSDSPTIKCHSEVWERKWLNKKEITVTCQNDGSRSKRGIQGGEQHQDTTDPKYQALAEQSLRKYTIDSGITQPLEVIRIDKVTTQVVAGLLTRIDFVVSVNRGSTTIICHSKIYEQGWLNHKDIDVSCHDDSHGGIDNSFIDQDPTEPQYKALAEESLRTFVVDSGITEPLEVARVERVITQVVSGMLETTGIDFTAAYGSDDSNSVKCHSDIWDRPSLSQKDITVSCLPLNGRVKRDLRVAGRTSEDNLKSSKYKLLAKEWIRGNSSNNNSDQQVRNFRGHGEEEQEPNKPEYKQLAEESLHKLYRKKSTVYHKVVEVQRVVTRVVSGFKYKIDFTAAPTSCSVNVSSVRARSCKADDDVLLYCHSEIWDRPWLRQKKIDVQCNGPKYDNDDFAEYESDNDLTLKPSNPQNNNDQKYMKLAEEASEKYLTSSNRKYVHKVTEIFSASEQVADGTLTHIEYSLSPTTCLRNETTNTTSCNLKQPLVVFHCNANIQIRPWLNVEKDITVTCKKNSESKKRKRESVARKTRQIVDDEDEIDEDTTYYYADRAVQHINDRSSSNNLHKLISIHAIQNSVQMGTLTVKMYIEVAETFCLRHHKSKDLRDCDEMSGLNHRLCMARLWPSPDDELVVRHVSVVCDDEEDFVTVTGVNIPELIRISVAVLESPAENKWKLIHQGEPQVIPSLDSRRPFKLNFIVAVTNCSKDVNLDKNPFQCYLNPNMPSRNCRAFIWLKAEAKYISNVEAHCTPIARFRRSALDPENVTLDYSEIQSMVRASLEQLEMQSLHRYKQRVLQINSHSTRITSGKVTTIDFDVGYTSCLKYEWVANITSCNFLEHLPRRRCVAQIWERLWISNGKNIDVNCVDDETPLESHIEFESAEMANELARQALKHIEAKYPHPSKQKVVRIFSLEKQVVAGIHYKMKVEIGFTDCLALSDQEDCKVVANHGLNKFCRINVWIRPWTDHPPNFRVSCDFQEGTTRDLYRHVQAEHLFYNFLTTYSPSYVNDYSQMHKRFEIFKNNIKKIHELNVHEKGTAVYGVTRFTDLTYEEFSTTYMGLNTNLTNENQVPMKQADIPNIEVPANFDWREYDAVTEVKDQGSCGSCWAFSVTGNIEGQWKMQSGQLVSLSEQELVDCDKLDSGCNGGLPDNAYRAIEQMGGLELESDYPYEGSDDKCVFNKTLAKVQISSAVNITSNETAMAQWLVHNGPISIGINANAMQFYMGGISHPWKLLCNPTNLDHGVLIVGYGVKDYPLFHKKLPYWIVKNSWGKSWGEQGYYRVYRGDGTCGVNQMASSAVI